MTRSRPDPWDTIAPALQGIQPTGRAQLLPALLTAQREFGYVSEETAAAIGQALRIPLAEIHGVLEFYSMLHNRPAGRSLVRVCTSPPCSVLGGEAVLRAACESLGVQPHQPTEDGSLQVEASPCLGLCDGAPAALVGEVPAVSLLPAQAKLWIHAPAPAGLGQLGGEPRWLTGRCGEIAPTDVDTFQQAGGFAGLKKALTEMSPQAVVEEIKSSGLVGRGGAAFPTGLKWQYAAAASGPRYIVCNADESEPGTFKDRVLLEGDPLSVLEGMLLAGYATGAARGYLYVRGEYPRAQGLLGEAIRAAAAAGFLGSNILGSDFSFEIELRSGAGAYICGEETALFESIEGRRGFPRLKPPFPTTHGLFGRPTAINNVETLCAAAWIVAHGQAAYRSIGTEDAPGSKLFCLSGDIHQPGVYEVPYGIPLGELLALGGGVKAELQAVLLGGAAGKFTGPEALDLPMSFEGLRAAGLPLGSGVVMVVNAERDLRQILLSLAAFFAHESCGKCFPCQLGTQRQLEILTRMAEGAARTEDVLALRDVEFTMSHASICGLGMTAGAAVISALDRWPQLFEAGLASSPAG